MFTLKQTILLALVGAAYAVPVAHRHRGDYDGPYGRIPGSQGWSVDGDSFTPTDDTKGGEIVYVIPDGGSFPQGGSGGSGVPDFSSGSGDSSSGVPSTGGSTGGSSDGSSGGSSGSDTGYMAIVNKYRTAGGLPAFTQDSKLESNAAKTARDGNGQMVHQLNPGTMGQVLAPGGPSEFEHVYVGGWLCEIPSLPGLNGICGEMSQGWSHDGQIGHAKILTNTGYSKIGCSNQGGIWACDCA